MAIPKRYSTDVIVDFDNEFHYIDRTTQKLLEVMVSFVERSSPLGYGDCGIMCDLAQIFEEDHDFRWLVEFKVGLSQQTLIEHLRLLDSLGYVQLEEDRTDSPLDVLISCKGWMASEWWNNDHLLDIAARDAGDNWDWDAILPLTPSLLRNQILEHLSHRRAA
jgi:DNA-binding transcriptional ArsR family regulator